MKRWWLALLTGLLLLPGLCRAEETTAPPALLPEEIVCRIPQTENAIVRVKQAKDGLYLFLPACASLDSLTLDFGELCESLTFASESGSCQVQSGEPFDLTALFPQGCDENGEYSLTIQNEKTKEAAVLTVMQSANQAAMWLVSDDPENAGREYIEAAPVEEKYGTTGKLAMVDENGTVVYDGKLRELRGRGNTTWEWGEKRPYQIKLAEKTDLLLNGNSNRARTWVLLAEAFDSTLLHNTLSLSMGTALGLEGTSEFRPVDLYYDGDYRGYYLLTEKVQVASGRLEIFDYTDYLEENIADIENRELYPLATAVTEQGNKLQYVENLHSDIEGRGAYLVELDVFGYAKEASWFQTMEGPEGPGWSFAVKSPEYAPRADVEYLCERMQGLMNAVNNGGTDPETGLGLSDYLDYESMARFLLVNALAKTCDFGYTSTYFYIPLGEERFYAGPIWDFDIAYGIRNNRPYEVGTDNYVPWEGWLRTIMTLPDFQAVMQRVFQEEIEPLLQGLLGEEQNSGFPSLDELAERIAASRRMNDKLWEYGGSYDNINTRTLYDTYEENLTFFREYLQERTAWLRQDIGLFSGKELDKVGLRLSYINAQVPESTAVTPVNVFPHYIVGQVSYTQEQDPEVAWHHLYTAEIQLLATEGAAFDPEMQASVNGCPAEVLWQSSGEVILRFRFSAPFYEEAIYDDMDYGLLFQYDYYIDQYPELLEEYGDDREAILANYVDYDLPEGISAIETFDYDLYYECYTRLLENSFTSDTFMGMLYYVDNEESEPLMGLGELIYPVGLTAATEEGE